MFFINIWRPFETSDLSVKDLCYIYICEYYIENSETEKPIFEEIFTGNILQQKKINEIFQQNFQQRIELKKIKPS